MNNGFLGVNYWASHAGTHMWRNWDAGIVEEDFKKLASTGIKYLRVFPVWSDFQPLTALIGWGSVTAELSHGDVFLDKDTEEGYAGIDETKIAEFDAFADIAEKYGFKLIVSLITGWMSGRCFIPEAFNGKNPITDPLSIRYEILFVKYFVKKFCGKNNIIAWEIGNECNCLGDIGTADEAFLWSTAIVDAIRVSDPSRPVISGMHGLAGKIWTIEDQAHICDYLTIHPYFLFTEHCKYDGLVSVRGASHLPAELAFYEDIGKRPCFVEEIGTIAPVFGCDEKVADFVRENLFLSWAYGSFGMFWWTGFDQMSLDFAPYDWCPTELELGIFREDGSPKPLAEEMKSFDAFLDHIPYDRLPPREKNAVCIVSPTDWTCAFGSYMLAKRAGIELKFSNKYNSVEDSGLYILPGNGADFMRKGLFKSLLEKVKNGSTLLVTFDRGIIAPFDEFVGCKSYGVKMTAPAVFEYERKEIGIKREYQVDLVPVTAKVILRCSDGSILLTENDYGKGKVLFFNAPVEKFFATNNDVAESSVGYEAAYVYAKKAAGIENVVEKSHPLLSLTTHKTDDGSYVVVAFNLTDGPISDKLKFNGVKLHKVYRGKAEANGEIFVPAADAVVMGLK